MSTIRKLARMYETLVLVKLQHFADDGVKALEQASAKEADEAQVRFAYAVYRSLQEGSNMQHADKPWFRVDPDDFERFRHGLAGAGIVMPGEMPGEDT